MLIRCSRAEGFIRSNSIFQQEVGYTDKELNQKPFIEWIDKNDHEDFHIAVKNNGSCLVHHKTKMGTEIPIEITINDLGEGPVILGLRGDFYLGNKVELETGKDATLKSTLNTIAEIVEEQNPGYFCSILLVAHGHFVAGAGPSLPDEYNNAFNGFAIGPTIGSCGAAVYWNVPVIVENIQKDPLCEPFAKLAKKTGLASCWSHPFVTNGGKVLGALAFYSSEPMAPTNEQLSKLRSAAKMTGLAVERGRAEEELRNANEIKSRFMSNMSHEIRTPLNALIGITDALDEKEEEITKEDISLIRDSSEQLLELFSGVLELTELSGRSGYEKIVELRKFCKTLIDKLNTCAAEKGIELDCSIANNIPNYVSIDEWALGRALKLLIGNAIKFTEVGKVFVEFYYKDQKLNIKIKDTGCGIDLKRLSQLREAFVQGDLSTKKCHGGFGLGLALSDLCIKALGGQVTFEHCAPKGTTVDITLPLVLAAEPIREHLEEVTLVNDHSDDQILIAEDNPVNGKVICKILKRLGYTYHLVENGKEAVKAYKEKDYSCILMDCQMPIMDGYEATQEIRSIERETRRNIPIIAVTANALVGDREICLNAGMNDYLKKPVRKSELDEKLREVMSLNQHLNKG